jgi:RNA polymerase sigma-70 factor (ECF subfamily)
MADCNNDIIKQCIKGEHKAQMQLYTTFYRKVYNSCFRILRDKYEAEDAMQESFIKAFSQLDKYKNAVPFEAWIVRIAIHTAIDKLRENKLELVDCDETNLYLLEEVDEKEDWEQTLEKVEQVKAAIERLPDTARLIINLYLIEGYDHEEIADILHIPAGTVRIQYMRAKQKLIELIKQRI